MITYPPIKFECQVSGKRLVAEVTTQVPDMDLFNFRTRFSDGFEDIFSHDKHRDIWNAGRDRKLHYLSRVKDDLMVLQNYQPFRHYLNFKQKIGQDLVNIWVFETQPEERRVVYSVYFKGDYQFDMKKISGVWYAGSVRQGSPAIDADLVSRVGTMIDTRIKK